MASKTKADQSFESKLKVALRSNRDFQQVEKVFDQYGHYLELIGGEPESQPPTEYTIQFRSDYLRNGKPPVVITTRRIA